MSCFSTEGGELLWLFQHDLLLLSNDSLFRIHNVFEPLFLDLRCYIGLPIDARVNGLRLLCYLDVTRRLNSLLFVEHWRWLVRLCQVVKEVRSLFLLSMIHGLKMFSLNLQGLPFKIFIILVLGGNYHFLIIIMLSLLMLCSLQRLFLWDFGFFHTWILSWLNFSCTLSNHWIGVKVL